jgi:hypothetical protein
MGEEEVGGVEPPATGGALDRLLAPACRAAFFANHYEQAPLLCGSPDSERFQQLLTLEAVDAFVATADLRHDMLRLVARGDPVDPSRYVGPDGRILPTAVTEAYLRGATIILPQLHLSLAPVAELCRALEVDFSAAVQANAYLTPGSAQGFDPHYDPHDVFILQIAGTKVWRLYGQAEAATAFVRGTVEPGPSSAEHVLSPGDCLYIPRGVMHEAANEGGEPSLHLTLGVHPKRWGELVLEAVAALVRDDPAFQRALPPGFATRPKALRLAEQQFAPLLARLSEGIRLDQALDRSARDFLHDRRPDISGVLASPQPAGRLRVRPLLLWRLSDDRGDIILTGPGGDLRFPSSEEATLCAALSGREFDPAHLPSPDPARLVERLWANGYLEGVPEG